MKPFNYQEKALKKMKADKDVVLNRGREIGLDQVETSFERIADTVLQHQKPRQEALGKMAKKLADVAQKWKSGR